MIVVGVDDSATSERAAARAVAMADLMDTTLHAVHVVHLPATLLTALAEMPSGITDFAAAEREAVWTRIDPVLSGASGAVERVDLEGYPPDTLVRYADENGAQMLVVGSRGRGEIAALFLGSTSHRVLHLAHCDVLVVRMEDDA